MDASDLFHSALPAIRRNLSAVSGIQHSAMGQSRCLHDAARQPPASKELYVNAHSTSRKPPRPTFRWLQPRGSQESFQRSQCGAGRCLFPLSQNQEFSLAYERPAFPRLPSAAGRAGAQIFAISDDIAERVRKIGGTTIRSIGHIAPAAAHFRQRPGVCAGARHAARTSR